MTYSPSVQNLIEILKKFYYRNCYNANQKRFENKTINNAVRTHCL